MGFETTVKEWFKEGLKPTQAQFWAKFSFLRWKDEKIPITDIDQIEDILNAKAEAAVVTNHLTSATAHATEFNAKEDKANKGEVNGYAPLNEFALIAAQYLLIVNDLTTGGSTSLASAETVKTLKGQIDAINILLASDNVNLDNVQEIVDAIETVQTSLSTILVNDLTTGGTTKALTAEMGKSLKELVDALTAVVTNHLTDANAHSSLFNAKEDKAQKGAANGYAPLDAATKLATQYLNIVNDLVTGGATALLSAEQGKQLKIQLDAVNTLLTSDNINLDTVQEIVDAIETVQLSLSTILVNDLTTGGTTKALTAEMGKQLDLAGLHKTGDETKTGSLIIKGLTVAFLKLFGTNQKAFEFFNDQNNLIASLRNGGASQGHWQFGTLSAYFEGRESGPQYLKASVPLEVPNATAANHAVNKSQVDELILKEFNVYFIDAINGNNLTGEFEDPLKPFQTIAYVQGLPAYTTDNIIMFKN